MRIELLGTSFSLQSDEDPAYLEDLVAYVQSKISEIAATVTTKDSLKISILTSILIADELFKIRHASTQDEDDNHRAAEEVNRIADALISRIDETLIEE